MINPKGKKLEKLLFGIFDEAIQNRGIILVAIALVIVDRVSTGDPIEVLENSRTAKVFARSQDKLDESLPEDAPDWITSSYQSLVSTCTE